MKTAFLFPGQGSQSVGMGVDVYTHFPAAAKVIDDADELLGYKLSTYCFYGPEETLRQTNITQPAVFTVSVAVLTVLMQHGVEPQAVAGHSVGEYAALVAAGALNWESGVRLVSQRGDAMRAAAEAAPGAMAAVIGLEADAVAQACAEVEASGRGIVEAANRNGAGQVVISGESAAMEAAGALLKERGARRVAPLPVAGAFHSRLMTPAAQAMRLPIQDAALQEARVPIVANVTAAYETTAAEIAANLAEQIDHPVLWEESVRRLVADGFDTFVEVGPGGVLSGLLRRIVPGAASYATGDLAALQAALQALGAAPGAMVQPPPDTVQQ